MGGVLLEREAELAALARALDAGLDGQGGALLVSGAPGAGKTALVDWALGRAHELGLRNLVARGSAFEEGFPFGVVEQLLGPSRALASAPAGRSPPDQHAMLHARYWQVVDLAEAGPVLVAVDDAHWVDEPSLRFLVYLARRLDGLRVSLVLAARSGEDGERLAPLREVLGTEPGRVEPAALSVEAVAAVLGEALGEEPGSRFATACHARAGGNAFLVTETSRAIREAGLRPLDANIGAIDAIVPESVGESVGRRLTSLGPAALGLAEAVAVLGDRTELGLAAALARLTVSDAAAAAGRLADAALLDDAVPLSFRHALVRAAVEANMTAARRAAGHSSAAELLSRGGGPVVRVAAHLLESPAGAGNRWAVEALRDASRDALAQGAPDRAVAWLSRALAEPPQAGERGPVLRELGSAAASALLPVAAQHLREALRLEVDPRARAEVALELAIASYYGGDHHDAVDVLLAAIDEAADGDLREERLRLEAFLGVAGRYDLATQPRVRGRIARLAAELTGATPAERLVRSVAALEAPTTAAELAEAARLAEAVGDELPWPDPAEGVGTVAMYLFAGLPDRAAVLAERLLASARTGGSPSRHAVCLASRGAVALDVGDVADAAADLGAAAASMQELRMLAIEPTIGYLVLALVETGQLGRADELLADHDLDGELRELMLLNPLLHARGALRAAQGRLEESVADQLELGRRHRQWTIERPSPPWRSSAAIALLALGDADRARALASEELEIAERWGTPKPVAIASRVLALAEGGERAIERLASATALLDGTPWRLERARTRLEHGAALRRAGRRRDARQALSLAMDEAHAGGATALADRAAQELRASGARPRRRALTGLAALTPAERRVVEHAAAGRTNREAARELFVTLATIETHLGRAYRKLGIDGRAGLAAILDGDAARKDRGTDPDADRPPRS